MSHPVLVEVLRGGSAESLHRGSLAIVDADGGLVTAIGDIDQPIFPRSAIKLLQALPLVESGAAERFALSDAELAQACASHSGEPEHVATSAAMLAKAGLDVHALECGTHWPTREPVLRGMFTRGEAATPLHNNCSGKHAGFVCVACQLALAQGADPAEFTRGYIRPDHPAMREVTAALAAATGTDLDQAPQGIDGCSIPTFGIALRALALGFARAGTGQGLSPGRAAAARRLRQAIARAPFHVAGTQRFDTRVMELFGERVCCKIGAEGVYCAALPELGLGVALKIDDGAVRAAEAAMAAVIEGLLAINDAQAALLQGYSALSLNNWEGVNVGAVRAAEALRSALRPA